VNVFGIQNSCKLLKVLKCVYRAAAGKGCDNVVNILCLFDFQHRQKYFTLLVPDRLWHPPSLLSEDFYLLGYDEIILTFRKNISLPSSGPKGKLSKKVT
jgi:hypothetical protein